ncbi:glycoside hydrolase family 108 protein [Aeromonas veronii]|uniref:glycoside hydrolase family 108 protein n=1 Tax=Aeromonas veronii TaxID=654 RepID=UPI001F21D33C|nr:glycosyl hydrolase 108 family protein [Aeromonas veronii]
MSIRLQVIDEVIQREGGDKFTDRAEDRGGPTRWGVTQATARQFGYAGNMRDYPKDEAVKVYTSYWDQLQLSSIEVIDADLATYLFDYGVNSGPGRAAKDLQRLLNVLNDRQKLYQDVKADGAIGPRSLSALESYITARGTGGKRLLAEAVNSLRIAHCITLAERQESQEANAYGWLSRVCNL